MTLDVEIQSGKIRGPLHGIPISVKDGIMLQATVSTNGMNSRSDNLDLDDGIIAKILKEEGAILFVKTNVHDAMMPEINNNIFGVSKNPHHEDRSCGGSSEGALIAADCSPAGYGTDIRGSLRAPAAF
jgi:amidase